MENVDARNGPKLKGEDLKTHPAPRNPSRTSKAGFSKHIRVTTEEERRTILAMALAGVSHQKIASELNLKPNTVYKFIRSKQKAWLDAVGTSKASPTSPVASTKKKCSKDRK